MLPAFASIDDLSDRLADGLADADVARAQAALDDASSRIRAEVRKSFADGDGELALPSGWQGDVLVRVCLAAALRAVQNPQGYDDQAHNAAPDVFLTKQEKRDVRAAAGWTGLGVIPLTRGDDDGTQWIDVDPPGEPLPWLSDPVGY